MKGECGVFEEVEKRQQGSRAAGPGKAAVVEGGGIGIALDGFLVDNPVKLVGGHPGLDSGGGGIQDLPSHLGD